MAELSRTAAGLVHKLRREGPRETAKRIVRRAYHQMGAASIDLMLHPADRADSARVVAATAPRLPADRPLRIGWLTTPPAAGSGGHTTMFRMVEALERAGHQTVTLLYDTHHGITADQARVVRTCWPGVRGEVRSVDEGLDDLDVCIATGWQTAHVLATRAPNRLHRFYFVQDYEPFFAARGPVYELAADSYRLGLTTIALGHMVQDRLRTELGVESTFVPFSCDTEVYGLREETPRSGVVLYAKPETPRRGYLLARLALEEFHRRRPDHEVHVYGSPVPDLDVPVTHHGRVTPAELDRLYNRCAAGLAMSFTNISLVAEEMLAAGCVPVVNDSPDARADLDSPDVAWAHPTPGGLADALVDAVDRAQEPGHARRVAGTVRTDNWRVTGDLLVQLVEDRVLEPVDGLAAVTPIERVRLDRVRDEGGQTCSSSTC